MKRWAKITLGTVVGFVVVGGIGNAIDPTPAPITTAADSTTTDVPPPAPTTTPSPAPAPGTRIHFGPA